MSNNSLGKKKLLESSWLNSISIPLLILLLGALIIFGVSKLLTTNQSYKDLVRELNSKSFGNKWVSAYELSKVINSSQIKKEDIPWIVENLKSVYQGSADIRTKQFIVVALGALKSKSALDVYSDVLKNYFANSSYKNKNISKSEIHSDILLQTLVALSKLNNLDNFNIKLLSPIFGIDDVVTKQTLFFLISKFKIKIYQKQLVNELQNQNIYLRYTAAISLTIFLDERSIPLLKEILMARSETKSSHINEHQRVLLISNVLTGLKNSHWKILITEIAYIAKNESNLSLRDQARKIFK